jgi:hypothetical protein
MWCSNVVGIAFNKIMQTVLAGSVLLAVSGVVHPLRAAQNHAELCDRAAAHAAGKTGVPLSVLLAITRVETGRSRGGTLKPWPWTVNMEGKGTWFDSKDAALAFVYKNYKRGARSFDVGCFQINYKWHGQEFASIGDMFDPEESAVYAARFLLSLYGKKGNWGAAAGAYHSSTETYATRYEKRFNTLRQALANTDVARMPAPAALAPEIQVASATLPETRPGPRINRFPLLQGSGGAHSPGSLFPRTAGASVKRFIPEGGPDG